MSQYDVSLYDVIQIWNLFPERDQRDYSDKEDSPDILVQSAREMLGGMFEHNPSDDELQELYEDCTKGEVDGCGYLGTLNIGRYAGYHVFRWDSGEIIISLDPETGGPESRDEVIAQIQSDFGED